MNAILIDLDGTLCDVTHRKHILEDRSNKNRWVDYAMACGDDTLVEGVLELIRQYMIDHVVFLVSGRADKAREKTEHWLALHDVEYDVLMMRGEGDHRNNVELKRAMIDFVHGLDHKVTLIVDDHEGVIEMASRDYSIVGLHVAGKPPYGYQVDAR